MSGWSPLYPLRDDVFRVEAFYVGHDTVVQIGLIKWHNLLALLQVSRYWPRVPDGRQDFSPSMSIGALQHTHACTCKPGAFPQASPQQISLLYSLIPSVHLGVGVNWSGHCHELIPSSAALRNSSTLSMHLESAQTTSTMSLLALQQLIITLSCVSALLYIVQCTICVCECACVLGRTMDLIKNQLQMNKVATYNDDEWSEVEVKISAGVTDTMLTPTDFLYYTILSILSVLAVHRPF